MRGVYPTISPTEKRIKGSSPHARGLPLSTTTICVRLGIIPARAGFTSKFAVATLTELDHPRTRGVYRGLSPKTCPQSGSSPHARGLRNKELPWGEPHGIIPARAGFTHKSYRTNVHAQDHPRTRGVYFGICATGRGIFGSSPHARGLPLAILGIPTVLESTTPRFPSLLT